MSQPDRRRWGTTIVVATTIALLGAAARTPRPDPADLQALAAPFAFKTIALPEPDGPKADVVTTHPALAHISGWVSAVGSSVALGDLDNDGLYNDVCLSEPRTKQVLVMPAPTTKARYEMFAAPIDGMFDAAISFPTGCMVGDFDEDGHDDLLVYFFGATPVVLLRDGAVPLGPKAYSATHLAVATDGQWYTAAATQIDLDADGHLDLVFGNYFREDARMYDPKASGKIEMQDSFSRAFNGGKNRLYLWRGADARGPRFVDASDVLPEEQAHAWTLAIGAADLDRDGRSDLYFANDYGPDRLLLNRSTPNGLAFETVVGTRGVTTPKSHVLGRDSFKGMGIDFADINNDLVFDMFVSNIAEKFALQETHFLWVSHGGVEPFQRGEAPYREESEARGVAHSYWGWDTRFGDFDNDGQVELVQATGFRKGDVNRWPELAEFAIGNDLFVHNPAVWPRFEPGDDVSGNAPNPFYVSDNHGGYLDVAAELNIAPPYVTRGVATSDIDGDGDLDLFYANQWEASQLLLNEQSTGNGFLGLHIVHTRDETSVVETTVTSGHPRSPSSSWPAIGTSAVLHLPDGTRRLAQIDGGSGHSGDSAKTMHFGLGNTPADTKLRVELCWRDRQGNLHNETVSVRPGWSTVVLARTTQGTNR